MQIPIDPAKYEALKSFIATVEPSEKSLIASLHKTQTLFGYIPREAQLMIAKALHLPAAKVYGVVTFYSYFTEIPRGKYQISVCLGTACYVKGAQTVLKAFEDELKIHAGETTDDLMFSICQSRCLGDCSNAPVVMINDEIYPQVHADEVPAILLNIREAEKNHA